ncbi:MAG: sulfatase-like hydrolase/transferase [Acidobacteriota bacterium]
MLNFKVIINSKKTLISALVLLITFLFQPASGSQKNKYNVLLITLDTTRADHIGCYNNKYSHTPNIDKLGKEGVIFENCYTPVPITLPAHASIFTGKYPVKVNVRNNGRYSLGDEHETIAEMLKKNDFHTFAVISSYVLISKFGLSQGFEKYDDSLDIMNMSIGLNSQIPADKVFNKFKLLLSKSGRENFFGWVHFYDPHTPYAPPGDYSKKFKKDLYLGEIAYMDKYVGKVIDELKIRGLYENTIIFIVGDHGEDKGEHNEYGHGMFCYNNVLKVPFIVVNSKLIPEGKRIMENVFLIDIFPTIAGLFNIKINKNIQGKSLLPVLLKKGNIVQRTLFFESMVGKEEMGWAPLTGLIDNGFKYISLPIPELYDLKKDPFEENNIFSENKELSGKMDEKLALFYKKNIGPASSGKRKLSKKDIEHLTSLGYISSFQKSGTKNIDPKTGFKYMDKLRNIKSILDSGNVNRAERELKKLFFSKDRIKIIHTYKLFEDIYRKKKDIKKMITFQKFAVKDFPSNENVKFLLANSYFNNYELDKAKHLCEEILIKNKKSTQALVLLGKIYLNKKDLSGSLDKFIKASLIEPKNIGIKKKMIFLYLKMRKNIKAIQILDKIADDDELKKNPDNIDLFIYLSKQFLRAGSYEKGIKLLTGIIDYSGEDPKIFTSLGDLYFRGKNINKAFNYYNKALELKKDHAPAMNGMGILFMTSSRSDNDISKLRKAWKYFDSAIKADPEFAEAYNGRGTANIFLQNQDLAVADLEKALELNPELIDIYFNLGIIYLRKYEKKKAYDLFRACKEKFYNNLNRVQRNRLERLIKNSLN